MRVFSFEGKFLAAKDFFFCDRAYWFESAMWLKTYAGIRLASLRQGSEVIMVDLSNSGQWYRCAKPGLHSNSNVAISIQVRSVSPFEPKHEGGFEKCRLLEEFVEAIFLGSKYHCVGGMCVEGDNSSWFLSSLYSL